MRLSRSIDVAGSTVVVIRVRDARRLVAVSVARRRDWRVVQEFELGAPEFQYAGEILIALFFEHAAIFGVDSVSARDVHVS
jgi:hypothetical protein